MTAWRSIALLTIVALLGACAPRYRTTYDFTPPRGQIGKLCSVQCAANHDSCRGEARNLAQGQYSQCAAQAQQEYQACLSAPADPRQPHTCILRQCQSQADYDNCDAEYRSCYSACGGAVVPQRHCVFDCPKGGAGGDS